MEKTIISNKLSKIFSNIGINTLFVSDMFYIDIDTETNEYITYIPENKYKLLKDNENPWKKYRNKLKIGKFFNKIFYLENFQIENLSHQYKIYYNIEIDNVDDIFNIVSGEDIYFYYQTKNYVLGGGTLNNSCMNNASEDKLSFYINNPDKIKLLIIKNDNNKLLGRCLMWETNKGLYLDRAYCRYDKDIFLYKKYAEIKKMKSYYTNKTSLEINDLKSINNNYLPYLDSFYIKDKKLISHVGNRQNTRFYEVPAHQAFVNH